MQLSLIPSQLIETSKLLNNTGQLEGVPKNPRFIRTERYKRLLKSVEDDPEMLGARELLVYPYGSKFVVLGGNMRLRALKELGYKEAPCKVIPTTTAAKLRAIVIKDNVGFGDDDTELLANEWDLQELFSFGVDMFDSDDEEAAQKDNTKVTDDTCPTCGQKIDNNVPF